MATETFSQLVERAQKGDAAALERILEDYGDAIQREIRFCLLDSRLQRVVGESDIYQSVVVRFALQLRAGNFQFDRPEDLVNLLKAIARARVAQASRHWHAGRRDIRKDTSLHSSEVAEPQAADPSASSVMARRELLEQALAHLSERDRQILQWRQEGMAWAEVAQRVGGASPEAIRKQHERALDRVAEEILPPT